MGVKYSAINTLGDAVMRATDEWYSTARDGRGLPRLDEQPQLVVRVGHWAWCALKADKEALSVFTPLQDPPTICGIPMYTSRRLVPDGGAWVMDPDKKEPIVRVILAKDLA